MRCPAKLTLPGPLALGLGLHLLEPLVVVRELLHVRERDLPRDDRIVVGHVGLRVVAAVLELDVHARAELLEIEAVPVDADRVADLARLLGGGSALLGHRSLEDTRWGKSRSSSSSAAASTRTTSRAKAASKGVSPASSASIAAA